MQTQLDHLIQDKPTGTYQPMSQKYNLKTWFNLCFFVLTALWLSSPSCLRAATISFTFQQTTATGVDLFTTGGSAGLITTSTLPSVYFALGYLPSAYDFTGKSRDTLVADIQGYIGSSNAWSSLGLATGGKMNVSFDNAGLGFATTTLGWSGKKLVAVISQGVNPVSQAITSTTPLAIVRGSGSAWDAIQASDPNPGVTIQSLSLTDFSSILVGTYAPLVGNVNAPGTVQYDTITLIPEPSSASMLAFGLAALLARRRRIS